MAIFNCYVSSPEGNTSATASAMPLCFSSQAVFAAPSFSRHSSQETAVQDKAMATKAPEHTGTPFLAAKYWNTANIIYIYI